MNTYAPAPSESASTRAASSAPQSSPPAPSSDTPARFVSPPSAVAYVPATAVPSQVHHRPPLHPHRHHLVAEHPWSPHHEHLKQASHPHPHAHPAPQQLSRGQQHQPLPDRSLQPPAQQQSHPPSCDEHSQEQRLNATAHPDHIHHRVQEQRPEGPHHPYHHNVKVVAQPLPGSRPPAGLTHQTYVYPVHHQLVAPVAHVPIGAAHFAHLPSSIWSPPHAQFAQPPHAQVHQLQPSHHLTAPPSLSTHVHGQHAYPPSHVHHIAAPGPPPPHAYTISAAPHTPGPTPPHALHPSAHPPQHHIAYGYAHVHPPPPPIAGKATISIPGSQQPPGTSPLLYATPPSADDAKMTAHLHKHEDIAGHAAAMSSSLGSRNAKGLQSSQKLDNFNRKDAHVNTHQLGHRSSSSHDAPHQNGQGLRPSEASGATAARQKQQLEHSKGSQQQQNSQNTPGQPVRKPRKPYTITKSREVWTPEEHSRFVHALQLYDRDWKKIEAYIGTKTVLQIRSHAQKHFGKVTKYKTGEYIPPPRPKKRAALPYPRSRSSGQSKSASASASNGTGSDSGAGSENGTTSGTGSGTGSRNGTNGNSSETVPSVAGSSTPSDCATVNGKVSTGSGSQAHWSKPMSSDKTGRHAPQHPFYNSSPRGSSKGIHTSRNSVSPSGEHRGAQDANPTPWNRNQLSPAGNTEAQISEWSQANGNLSPRSGHQDRSSMQSSPRILPPGAASDHTIQPSEGHGQDGQPSKNSPSRRGAEAVDIREHPSPPGPSGEEVTTYARHPRDERKRIPVPNDSLLVLSNCVDLVARDTPPDRQPAVGWATAAAARRAHRAKVMRARKPPLPQARVPPVESLTNGEPNSQHPDILKEEDVQPPGHVPDPCPANKIVEGTTYQSPPSEIPSVESPDGRDRSPPAGLHIDEGSAHGPPDPQRSSSGSGTGSDDAIAGFSSSDRPSVSNSAAGSGTGGSLETSDTGDPEEDPKSSNDGSGDDGNRQSPETRDSSPADPNSSGSRENSPNDSTTESHNALGSADASKDSGGNRTSGEEGERPALNKKPEPMSDPAKEEGELPDLKNSGFISQPPAECMNRMSSQGTRAAVPSHPLPRISLGRIPGHHEIAPLGTKPSMTLTRSHRLESLTSPRKRARMSTLHHLIDHEEDNIERTDANREPQQQKLKQSHVTPAYLGGEHYDNTRTVRDVPMDIPRDDPRDIPRSRDNS